MTIGERIAALRRKSGWTQEQLAEKLALTRQSVAKWESGAAQPELENLITLSDLFQTTLDELARGPRGCTAETKTVSAPVPDTLINFLLRAGKVTYAGKGTETPDPSVSGAHEYRYEENDSVYRDRYFGGEHFAGGETLHVQGRCVWAMNYCGRVLDPAFPPDFLKAALLLRPKEAPYRGPSFFRDGRYVYINEVNGAFGWFEGREAIYCDDRRVYEGVYHGGTTG